VLYRDGTGIVY